MVVVQILRISLLLGVALAALMTFHTPGLVAGSITQTSVAALPQSLAPGDPGHE